MKKSFLLVTSAAALLLPGLLPGSARAQAVPLSPLGSFWLTPYVGVGFQGEYHDAVVQFADGDRELLRLEPGNAIVYGVHAGYRSGTVLTMQASLSLSVPEAT